LNEIFIGATRPLIQKREVKRIMTGLTCEALKMIKTQKLDSEDLTDTQKFHWRNSYYQIIKNSSSFCYNDEAKGRVNSRVMEDELNISKLLVEQGMYSMGIDIESVKLFGEVESQKKFVLTAQEKREKAVGYYRVKESAIGELGPGGDILLESYDGAEKEAGEPEDPSLSEGEGEGDREIVEQGGADGVDQGGIPFYDLTKED